MLCAPGRMYGHVASMGRGIPPAYIFSILPDRLLLSGGLTAIFGMLRDSRYRAQTSRETPSTVAVRFTQGLPEIEAVAERHALLRWLSDHGVAFAEKHSSPTSVAAVARGLQQSGALPRRIAVIRWSSQDEWKVRHENLDGEGSLTTVSI